MSYFLAPASLLLLPLLVLPAASQERATAAPSFDMAKDFSYSVNPNGPWEYLGNGVRLENKIKLASQVEVWNNGGAEPNISMVAKNISASTITLLGDIDYYPGYLQLDPQSGVVAVRWTAPRAGTYTVAGSFICSDYSGMMPHYVEVTFSGSPTSMVSGQFSQFGQTLPFSFNVTVEEGQWLDFVVLPGSDYRALGTNVEATFTLQKSSATKP